MGRRTPRCLLSGRRRTLTSQSVHAGSDITKTNERHCVNSASVKFVKGGDAAPAEEAPVVEQ